MAPSSIVVTDRPSLAENFAENAKTVLCSASFGAGALAIGGALVGAPPLAAPYAIATGAALLAGLAFCPAFDTSKIFGQQADFSDGQCSTQYKIRYTKSDDVISPSTGVTGNSVMGPILRRVVTSSNTGAGSLQRWGVVCYGPNDVVIANFDGICFTAQGGTATFEFVRADGLPDNCGNAPNAGGQVVTNTSTGDTIDNSTVNDNRNYSKVIPVLFNLGGIKGTMNLKFGDIKIKSLLPIDFKLNISGTQFRFKEGPDGKLKPEAEDPDERYSSDPVKKLLEEIKECTCKPDVDMDMLFVPYATEDTMCERKSLSLLIPKGSIGPREEFALNRSAQLSSEMCKQNRIEQQEPKLITAATINRQGAEFFSPEFSPKIISVRIKITGFNEELLPKINLYPASNQRKFGSVAYTLVGFEGGGDYIYVFDADTYFPLPIRAKAGIIRVLFKPGTSFEIWDTGERTKTR
jgi:hypothetical protein